MKNLSEDPLENLFQSRFQSYEKPAAMEPLHAVMSKLSAQQTLSKIYIAAFLLLGSMALVTYLYNRHSTDGIITESKTLTAKDHSENIITSTLKTETISKKPNHSSDFSVAKRLKKSLINSSTSEPNRQLKQVINNPQDEVDTNFNLKESAQNSGEIFSLNSLIPKTYFRLYQPAIPTIKSGTKTEVVKKTVVREIYKKTRSSFHAQVLPMLLYNVVTPNKNDGLFIKNFVTENVISTQRIALRASLNYEVKISKKLRLTTGASFLYKRLSFSYESVMYETDSTTVTTHLPGVGFQIKTQSIDTVNSDQRISISSQNIGGFLGVIYQLNGRHQFGLNFEIQKHLNSIKASQEKQLGIVDQSFIYLHYLYEHPLNKKITINIQPTISYSLNSMNSSSPITVKPYGIGLGIGVKYKLFKTKKIEQIQKGL